MSVFTHKHNRWMVAFALITLHAALVLELNFPGHLSVDSMMHLYEWHTKEQVSFNPVFVTWWVGLTNFIWPEGGGAMLMALAMHCTAIGVLVWAIPNLSRWVLLLMVVWSVWPVMVLYDGNVWKDVMFANAAILAASLAYALYRFPRAKLLWIFVLLLAPFLVLARQNGLAFAVFLAIALAYAPLVQPMKWAAKSMAIFIAMVAFSAVVNVTVGANLYRSAGGERGAAVGLILLAVFDSAGILANDGKATLNLPELDAASNEAIARELRTSYSPTRLDTLQFEAVRNGVSVHRALSKGHFDLIKSYPLAWLQHRFDLFTHVLGLRNQHLCMPTFVGVTPLSAERAAVMPLSEPRSPWIEPMGKFFFDNLWGTPVFSGASYMGVVLVVGVLALAMRAHAPTQARVLLVLLALGTLSFCFSFLLIGISCDFRYTYLAVPMAFWLLIAWFGSGQAQQFDGTPATATQP
jgi:hypothetical protein